MKSLLTLIALRRAAPCWLALLLSAGSFGCSGNATTSSSAGSSSGAGGAGGSGGSGGGPSSSCVNGAALAQLTAPAGEGFGEAVVVAAGSEMAVAYTQWNEARDVAVKVQRLSSDGAALGSPILLHTYNVCCGQLALGGFYGALSMATDGSRYLLCWAEAEQVGCAAVSVGSGDASFSPLPPAQQNQLVMYPHVALGPSGWYVFYRSGGDGLAQHLGNDAKAIGAPVAVPEGMVTATASGYAVASTLGNGVSRLGPDLKMTAGPIPITGGVDGIAALGDAVSIVGAGSEARVDVSDQVKQTMLTASNGALRMAVAPRKGSVGVVWSSNDDILRFSAVDAASHAGPVESVGCSEIAMKPSIAATGDGFLVAALRPEGGHEIFYNKVYPTIRVTHVQQP